MAKIPKSLGEAVEDAIKGAKVARAVAQDAKPLRDVLTPVTAKPSRVSKLQQKALRVAQVNASKPVSKGGLGLQPDNTPEERALAMGFNTDVYHGTKQDITGAFKPIYDDGLSFTTPYPEFANNWIGKGKLQSRKGGEEQAKEIWDQHKEIKSKHIDNDRLAKLEGAEFRSAYDEMYANAKNDLDRSIGLNPDKIHSTVYPMKYRAEKLFDPEKDFAVMDEYADNLYRNDKVQSNEMKKLYRTGNYMLYETKPVIDFLKSKGYDAIRLKEDSDGIYTTIAPFSPNQLRSRFAVFDPMRKDSGDLMAGMALPVFAVPQDIDENGDNSFSKMMSKAIENFRKLKEQQ